MSTDIDSLELLADEIGADISEKVGIERSLTVVELIRNVILLKIEHRYIG